MSEDTGRFFGLPEEFCDPDTAAAAVLPVPYDGTSTWKKGADRGPHAIMEASEQVELYDIETASEPYRAGIATLAEVRWGDGPPEEVAEEVERRTTEVLDKDQLPVLVGGEHSISIGAMRAVAARHPGVTFLQIDAHGDTRDTYEGSNHNHACVMARARELGPIVQVGVRAIDISEARMMDPGRVFFAHDIHSDGDAWIERVVGLLGPDVYVTIDMDAFDPALVPATGTPEPGGLSWEQVMGLLSAVAGERRVVAFDVVELMPQPGQHASEFVAAKLIYRFLAMIWAARPPR